MQSEVKDYLTEPGLKNYCNHLMNLDNALSFILNHEGCFDITEENVKELMDALGIVQKFATKQIKQIYID